MKCIFYTICILICSNACVSVVDLTDAESYGKNNICVDGYVEQSYIKHSDGRALPIIYQKLGYGLTDKLDVFFTWNTYLVAGSGVKYQFINRPHFQFAAGLKVRNNVNNFRIERTVPTLNAYMSVFQSRKIKLLINPSASYVFEHQFRTGGGRLNRRLLYSNLSIGLQYEIIEHLKLKFGGAFGYANNNARRDYYTISFAFGLESKFGF